MSDETREQEAQHTPWHYQEGADDYTHIVRGSTGRFICSFGQDSTGQAEKDARCCAAQWDMLEALEELERLKMLPTEASLTMSRIALVDAGKQARASIAKARGKETP